MKNLEELRANTSELHQQLEATSRASAILSLSLQPSEYLDHLRWWHGHWSVLMQLEQRLRPEGANPLFVPRDRVDKASTDIKCLVALSLPPSDGARTPCTELVLAPFEGSWLGLVYVMRGSELGGDFIAKQLRKSLKGTPAINHLGFFERVNEPSSWPQMVAILEHKLEEPLIRAQCIIAAQQVFAWLIAEAD